MVTPIAPCRLVDTRPLNPKGPLRREVGPAETFGGHSLDAPIDSKCEPPFLFSSLPTASDTWSVTFERGAITRRFWTATADAVCVATP